MAMLLVAEDQPSLRNMAMMFLDAAGVELRRARNGGAAVELGVVVAHRAFSGAR